MVHYTHMHSPEIVSIAHKLHTQINVHVAEYHQHEAWHSSLSCCMCCVMRAVKYQVLVSVVVVSVLSSYSTVKYPTILMFSWLYALGGVFTYLCTTWTYF